MSSGRGIRPYGFQAMLVKVGKDVAAFVGIYILIVNGDFYRRNMLDGCMIWIFLRWAYYFFLIIGLFVWL